MDQTTTDDAQEAIPNVSVTENKGAIISGAETVKVSIKQNAKDQAERELIREGIKALENKVKREFATAGGCLKRLPWLKENSICDYYVDLTIEERNGTGKIVKNKNFPFRQLFQPSKVTDTAPKTILVLGGAGFGKSTLATKILHEWSTKIEDHPAVGFQILLLCRLREVTKGEDIESFILKYCEGTLGDEFKNSIDIRSLLKPVREKLLIILDGYDEICHNERLSVKKVLSKNSFFHSSTFMVTSRPGDLDEDFINSFERHISISPLSETSQNNLIDKVFVGQPEKAVSVKTFLRDHKLSFLSELSPLLLFSVCSIFEEEQTVNICKGADLIYKVARIMFLRADVRESGKRTIEEDKLNDIFCQLGKLCFDKLAKSQLYFETDELLPILNNGVDFLGKLGLFQPIAGKADQYWEPIQKVFSDVLAVHYLNTELERAEDIEKVKMIVSLGLGQEDQIQTIVFVSKLEVLAFWSSHKEFVYVTFASKSIYEGVFYTFDDLKAQYYDYICRFKGNSLPNVLVYYERNSLMTISELFGEISSTSSSIKRSLHIWNTNTSNANTVLPRNAFKFQKYGALMFAGKNSKCKQTCSMLNLLAHELFWSDTSDQHKNSYWGIKVDRRERRFEIIQKEDTIALINDTGED